MEHRKLDVQSLENSIGKAMHDSFITLLQAVKASQIAATDFLSAHFR
jgi:hypothetical protein